MKSEAECEECRRLLENASVAITQQLRALARLDLARLRQETDLVPSLETAVREAKVLRESAVAAYKEHRKTHGPGVSNGAAAG